MAKYGLEIAGTIRVFRKDKEIKGKNKKTFTVTDVWFNVSEKEEDGTWFSRSMNLLFKKDLELPPNNTNITFTGFPIITGDGNYRKIAIMVMDWYSASTIEKNKTQTTIDISEDDLPF